MTTEFMQLQFAREAITRAIQHLDEALGREMDECLQHEIVTELTALKNSRRTVNDLIERKRGGQ